MKTILLHVQEESSLKAPLQSALAMARCFNAHLSCLQVTPIEAYVAFDSFGGVFVMSDVLAAITQREGELRSLFESALSHEDVSWDYAHVTGHVANSVISHAALADVIVTGRNPADNRHYQAGLALLGDLLHRSRTPILIPGDGSAPYDPSGPALIAWDGSYEAANAVRASLSLLARASDVRVVTVDEQTDKPDHFPSTRLMEFLSRHGIHADLRCTTMQRDMVATSLVGEAQEFGASTLVLGSYSHSRIGEYLFGGVTRTLLSSSPMALLTTH